MNPAEAAFAETFAAAVAADLAANPTSGPLVRLIVRWFDDGYLSAHAMALGAGELDGVGADEDWSPLEWETADRELERGERIDAAVTGAYEALHAAADPDAEPLYAEFDTPDAVVGAVRALPDALATAGVEVDDGLAITAQHYEEYGGRAVLEGTAPPQVVAALRDADRLPAE